LCCKTAPVRAPLRRLVLWIRTWPRAPAYTFELDVDAESASVLDLIDRGTTPLGECCDAYFGNQTFDRSEYVADRKERQSFREVIGGTNVQEWSIARPREFVDYRPEAIKSGGEEAVYARDRIVVRQIGSYPEGSICPPGLLTLNTIYNIFEKVRPVGLKFILAIINSSTTAFYWKRRFFDNKETFPKIKKAPLLAIRLPVASAAEKQVVTRLVDYLLWLNGHFAEHEGAKGARDALMLGYWQQMLNGLVYELYFADELHAKDLRLFDRVAQADLPALDDLPKADRLARLRRLFETLYDTTHPLRGALHTLRSLETVRIIEGET
jgi:hypothetical protein